MWACGVRGQQRRGTLRTRVDAREGDVTGRACCLRCCGLWGCPSPLPTPTWSISGKTTQNTHAGEPPGIGPPGDDRTILARALKSTPSSTSQLMQQVMQWLPRTRHAGAGHPPTTIPTVPPTHGCFYGCFWVIEAHGGRCFRTPCPNCRAKPFKVLAAAPRPRKKGRFGVAISDRPPSPPRHVRKAPRGAIFLVRSHTLDLLYVIACTTCKPRLQAQGPRQLAYCCVHHGIHSWALKHDAE